MLDYTIGQTLLSTRVHPLMRVEVRSLMVNNIKSMQAKKVLAGGNASNIQWARVGGKFKGLSPHPSAPLLNIFPISL